MEEKHHYCRGSFCRLSKNNIIQLFFLRQTHSLSQQRISSLMIRKLIKSNHRNFSEIWNKNSASAISYDGHLYFANFRIWFAGCFEGNGAPHMLYNRAERRTNWRIEDALRFESSSMSGSMRDSQVSGYLPCLFAVTSDGWLIRFKQTPVWKALEKVYLGERYHFKHMQWVCHSNSFALKSIRFCGPGWMMRRATSSQHEEKPFIYLALFNTAPFKFVVNIGVLKSVWGEDLIDANLAHGMLVTMHRRDKMKLYDLTHLIEKHREKRFHLGDEILCPEDLYFFPDIAYNESQRLSVGQYPCGLPLTLTKAERPAVLLGIKSCHGVLSFGGFPWKIIVSNNKKGTSYKVLDIEEGKTETNIENHNEIDTREGVFFHEDGSGRILSIEQETIRCLSLKQDGEGRTSCFCEFKINVAPSASFGRASFSSSGRSIKWRTEASTLRNVIHDIDYDDETELIAVLSSGGTESAARGCVGLYDNRSGELVRQCFLNGEFDDSSVWSIFIDRDLIFCLSKEMSSSRVCTCKILKLIDPMASTKR